PTAPLLSSPRKRGPMNTGLWNMGPRVRGDDGRHVMLKQRRIATWRYFVSSLVDRIDPWHLMGLLDGLDVKVDPDRFVVAAHPHAFERLARTGVDFLVRHKGRHIDEIARTGLGGEFEPLAPAHSRLAAHHVDDAFQLTVMMRAGLRVRTNIHRTSPNLLGADAGIIDGGLAIHARRLRGIGIERVGRNDAHAIVLPPWFGCRVHVRRLHLQSPGRSRDVPW